MDWSDWIALSSALVALIALAFSLVGYFKYDKPIKTLQKEKLIQEALENKRADFEIIYKATSLSGCRLRIQNIGKVIARNIDVELRSKKSIAFSDGTKQHVVERLEPTQKTGHLSLIGECPFQLKLKLKWDDESGERREKNFYVDKQKP